MAKSGLGDYEKLLDRAYSQLPDKTMVSGERFQYPEVNSFVEGNRTIFKNFLSVVEKLNREPSDLAKYLSKELGAPVNQEGNVLVIQKRVKQELLQRKVENYIEDYVICHECRRPDTHFVVEEGIRFIICEACGARRVSRK